MIPEKCPKCGAESTGYRPRYDSGGMSAYIPGFEDHGVEWKCGSYGRHAHHQVAATFDYQPPLCLARQEIAALKDTQDRLVLAANNLQARAEKAEAIMDCADEHRWDPFCHITLGLVALSTALNVSRRERDEARKVAREAVEELLPFFEEFWKTDKQRAWLAALPEWAK